MADAVRDRARAARIVAMASGSRLIGSWQGARALLGAAVQSLQVDAIRAEEPLQRRLANRESANAVLALQDPCFEDENGCWDLIADIWVGSSVMMAQLASEIGAQYIHVLQPNQYTQGGKELTTAERKFAFRPNHPWSRNARTGYPHLLARAQDLRDRDIAFFDFSNLFRDREETIYRDSCCHYNELGNEILSEAIAELVPLP